jgi:hypothetical protein
VGHAIFSTVYCVNKLDAQLNEKWINFVNMDEKCWNGWKYDRRMYEPTAYAVFSVVVLLLLLSVECDWHVCWVGGEKGLRKWGGMEFVLEVEKRVWLFAGCVACHAGGVDALGDGDSKAAAGLILGRKNGFSEVTVWGLGGSGLRYWGGGTLFTFFVMLRAFGVCFQEKGWITCSGSVSFEVFWFAM